MTCFVLVKIICLWNAPNLIEFNAYKYDNNRYFDKNNSKIVIFLLKNLDIRSKITTFAAEIKNKRSLIYGKSN